MGFTQILQALVSDFYPLYTFTPVTFLFSHLQLNVATVLQVSATLWLIS